MDKSDIIPGEVYMGRDGKTPYLLVTNRLYSETHEGRKVNLEIAGPEVKAARRATAPERAQKTWRDCGYFTLRPTYVRADVDYVREMQAINLQSLLAEDKLPIPGAIPSGYEMTLITSLASFKGDYAEIRAKQISENERAAQAAKLERERYNAIVEKANDLLGDMPLDVIEGPWIVTPTTFELSIDQMQKLLGIS